MVGMRRHTRGSIKGQGGNYEKEYYESHYGYGK